MTEHFSSYLLGGCAALNSNQYFEGVVLFFEPKGQMNRKADWRAVDSPKKRTDEFDLFAMKSKKAN